MSESKKRFGIFLAIAVAAVILFAALIAIRMVFNANKFRPELESRLSGAIGRQVRIGDLELSLLSGSLRADNISIADDPAFSSSPFLEAGSLQIGIELKPLIFNKAFYINGLTLDKPAITLIRSPSGQWNFSGFGLEAAKERTARAPGGSPGTEVSVRRIKITDGRIVVIDQPRKPSVYDDMSVLATGLSLTSAFPFTLNASLPGGGRMELKGKAGPLSRTDMTLTPLAADLTVTSFDLVASGFIPADSGLAGLIDFGGTMNSDGVRMRSAGRASAGRLQVARHGSPSGRPVILQYAVEHDLEQQHGTLRDTKVEFGKAVARLSGIYDIRGSRLEMKMKLQGRGMPLQDLQALLPAFGITLPKGASLEGGTIDVDLMAEGAVDRLVITGTAEITRTRLTGFDLAGNMAAIAALAGLKRGSATDIERFFSDVRLTREGTQVNRLELIVPAVGELSGNGRMGPDQSLDLRMRAVLKPSGGIGGTLGRLAGGGRLQIPFFVRGTASDPKFLPDVQGATGGLLRSAILANGAKEGQADIAKEAGTISRDLLQKKK